MIRTRSLAAALGALAALAAGCGGDDTVRPIEDLYRPETCMECHPKHFREWSGSMHAYAGDDPMFRALNRLGQEETGGALGDFCVRCHAPMAVALGMTQDGLDLDQVPAWARGVTCFFCHNATEVAGDHNNPIQLAMDQTMRAGLADPVRSPAHHTDYSPLIDAENQASSQLCGSCHDIVTPAGVHIERTFAEWKTTIFSATAPTQHLSCGACHMIATTDVVAEVPGVDVPLRPYGRREHTFAAIDVALTPWPEQEAQRAAIARDLKAVVQPRLCVLPADGGRIDYRLDDVGAGHMFPSGATVDRRAWVEIVAYDDVGAVLYSSGLLPAGQPYLDPEELGDPDLWQLGTRALDDQGQPTELFWRIASIDHPGSLLLPAVTTDPQDPRYYHAIERSFPVPGLVPSIARITARVLIRPVPMRLVEELYGSGHLAEDLRPQVPLHVVEGSVLEWTPATADSGCVL